METYFVKKICAFDIACGYLIVYVDQQHNVSRLKQKKQAVFGQPCYGGTAV